MKIDLDGAYSEHVDKYIKAEDKESITKAAGDIFGGFEGLSIENWDKCMQGDFSGVLGEIRGTWAQVYWMKGFVEFASKFVEMLTNLSPKMDADEERAAESLLPSTIVESVLVFTRQYFGLHSFSEAAQITLGEVLIAKKATYNELTFRKRLSTIQMAKVKQKRI